MALGLGIGKKELLNDYYWDEILIIFDEYSIINAIDDEDDEEEIEVDPMEFMRYD